MLLPSRRLPPCFSKKSFVSANSLIRFKLKISVRVSQTPTRTLLVL
jgi:hypothetical protein